MLQRTNIYLHKQTIQQLKVLAEAENTTMSDIVREAIQKKVEKKKNWKKRMLELAKNAGNSGLGDLSKCHDYYLYNDRLKGK